ncbi:MAG: right-handed parallel beta-helix repeat-containing protein, partial [Clostridia bacterium]|nr:right-handed parallel beta-helix repeat-containing protein [Clostridia bacterium]
TQAVCMYTKYAPHRGMHLSNYSILRTQGAAIQVDNAENIIFDNNVIRNTGVIGIAFGNDVQHSTVSNCVLRDIGSSAIVVGDPRHVYIGDGDYPEGVEGLCEYITLHKNIMKDTSVLSLQAPAITAIFGKHIDITNNFLENAAYTGISLGWGWVDFTSRKRENPTHSL